MLHKVKIATAVAALLAGTAVVAAQPTQKAPSGTPGAQSPTPGRRAASQRHEPKAAPKRRAKSRAEGRTKGRAESSRAKGRAEGRTKGRAESSRAKSRAEGRTKGRAESSRAKGRAEGRTKGRAESSRAKSRAEGRTEISRARHDDTCYDRATYPDLSDDHQPEQRAAGDERQFLADHRHGRTENGQDRCAASEGSGDLSRLARIPLFPRG